METDGKEKDFEGNEFYQVRFMKIAVAVACCALKPKNVSVRSFTQDFCDAYHESNRRLQTKCSSMEAELLHLRQQIAMNSMIPDAGVTIKGSHSQQDILSEGVAETVFPTPPLSGSELLGHNVWTGSDGTESLHKNTQFLQSVINLQQAAGCTFYSENSESSSQVEKVIQFNSMQKVNGSDKTDQENSTVINSNWNHLSELSAKTIDHSLQIINKCLQEKTVPVSIKLMEQCTFSMVQLLDKSQRLANNDSTILLIKDILQSLVACVMENQDDKGESKAQNREQYMSLVLQLSKSPAVRVTLDLLIAEIEKFSQHLREVCCYSKLLDVCKFENIIFLITLLESVLNQYLSSSVRKDKLLLESIKDKLDASLLHVTERYPLYAHSIWKICGQLELALMN